MPGYRRIKDYYRILGITTRASREEIDRSFRSAAKETHPDLVRARKGSKREVQAAEERFKAISDAYSILGSEEKRKKYDKIHREVHGTDEEAPAVQYRSAADGHAYTSASDLEDIYRDLFDNDGRPRERCNDGRQRAPEEEGCRFDDVVNLGPGTRLRKDTSIGRIPTNVKPTYGLENDARDEGLGRIGRITDEPPGNDWEKVSPDSFRDVRSSVRTYTHTGNDERWERIPSGKFGGMPPDSERRGERRGGHGSSRHTAPPEYSTDDGGKSWENRIDSHRRAGRTMFLKWAAPRLIGFLLIAAAIIFVLDHFNVRLLSNCCFCGSLMVLFLVVLMALSYRDGIWISSRR